MSKMEPCRRCRKSISVTASACPHCKLPTKGFGTCTFCLKPIDDEPERKLPFSIDILLPFLIKESYAYTPAIKASKNEPLDEYEKRILKDALQNIARDFHDRCLREFLDKKAQMEASVKCRTCGKELRRDSLMYVYSNDWGD